MPDYENDLAFKPALSWEELCEWAKSKGADMGKDWFDCVNLTFHKTGGIESYGYGDCIAENVSYERMKTIINALYGED